MYPIADQVDHDLLELNRVTKQPETGRARGKTQLDLALARKPADQFQRVLNQGVELNRLHPDLLMTQAITQPLDNGTGALELGIGLGDHRLQHRRIRGALRRIGALQLLERDTPEEGRGVQRLSQLVHQ
ncbi:MAG: hypothetical protein GVY22_10030 [Gammaproteobacteria bacterium]|nr:hypothetical protein [Gammaproteobacteria bacterium]